MTVQAAPEPTGSPLVELSNAMVALHRQHFGRGPAAARVFINDGIAICVLTDIYSRAEQTLIEAGHLDHVRKTRQLHQQSVAGEYRVAGEAVLGRAVVAFMSSVHSEPDVAIDIFLLGDRLNSPNGNNAIGERGPSEAAE